MANPAVTRSGGAFFSLASAGLCLAALLTTQWYSITLGTVSYDVGAYKLCVNGACDRSYYTAVATLLSSSLTCNRSPDDLGQRANAVFGLTIAGGALCLISFLVTVVAGCRSQLPPGVLPVVAVLGSLLGFSTLAAADVLFPFVWHKWLFCDTPFCDSSLATNPKCDSFFGYSFAFVIVAAACAAVATVLHLVTAVSVAKAHASSSAAFLPPPATLPPPSSTAPAIDDGSSPLQGVASVTRRHRDGAEHPIPPGERDAHGAFSSQAHHTQESNGRFAAEHVQAVSTAATGVQRGAEDRSPIAENRRTSEMRVLTNTTTNNQSLDGWELDPNTGLYWSDTEKLFYDPVSGHFYDPESELWYDPTTEQWYQGAEQ